MVRWQRKRRALEIDQRYNVSGIWDPLVALIFAPILL